MGLIGSPKSLEILLMILYQSLDSSLVSVVSITDYFVVVPSMKHLI